MTTSPATLEDLIAGYTDDTLATVIDEMGAEGARLMRMAGQARLELTRRLVERGATHMDTESWEGVLKPGPIVHEVADPATLRKLLLLHLPANQVYEAIDYPPAALRVNHRQLNELTKLGGEVRRLIEEARTSRRGEPKLELKRKVEAE